MISAVTKRIIRSSATPYLLLGLTAIGTLFFRIGRLPFLGNDECRYARIAEEMNQAGRWITPVLQGFPWLEKPPLYYWMTILSYKLFGVSEASARIAPAVCALLAAVSILWLGSRLWSPRAGLLGGLIILTAIGYCGYGRSASPDMPITACLTIAFALLAAAVVKGDVARWKIWSAYFLLGLGVLAKGPVALVLGAGILILFWTLDEEGGSLKSLHFLSGSVIALAVALPWHLLAFRETGFTFISSYLINHNFARYVTEVHHHEQPFFYFVPIMLGLLFPWTGWLPVLIPHHPRLRLPDLRTWDRSTLFLGCWALFPFLFFSFSNSKLPGYILPSLPPLALLLGRRLTDLIETSRQPRATVWFYVVLMTVLAVAFPVYMWRSYEDTWRAGLLLTLAVALPALWAFWLARRGNLRGAIGATVVQGLVFVLAVTQFGFAPLAEYNSANDIAIQAVKESAGTERIVTFSYFDQTLLYYTDYHIDANITDASALLEYAQKQPSFLIVTTAQLTQDLMKMPQLSVTKLGEQGRLRLLRARYGPQTSDLRPQTSDQRQNPEVRSQHGILPRPEIVFDL
jgi:4-amino-4-deoxy-L-arabinose transferase-like glycosyltransferase